MIEIKGDFTKIHDDYSVICCTTNTCLNKKGELVMGAGIAKFFKEEYDFLPKVWGEKLKRMKKRNLPQIMVDLTIDVKHGEKIKYLVAFPTKTDFKKNSTLELIENSAKQLEFITDSFGWDKILLPKPGCSNGGLLWEDVKGVLSFLDDRFHVIGRE